MESESARRYEEAVRADALGQLSQARTLAQQGLALSPQGPYAASLQRLLDRVNQEELEPPAATRLPPDRPLVRAGETLNALALGEDADFAGDFAL